MTVYNDHRATLSPLSLPVRHLVGRIIGGVVARVHEGQGVQEERGTGGEGFAPCEYHKTPSETPPIFSKSDLENSTPLISVVRVHLMSPKNHG